ncbi:Ribonuclease H [Yarrowia sp. C11]|nr:Ribonuclease H [Yarrowia sp. E02]KAG5372448.1 Ribonuclease H [Yarrowia sp. C11]
MTYSTPINFKTPEGSRVVLKAAREALCPQLCELQPECTKIVFSQDDKNRLRNRLNSLEELHPIPKVDTSSKDIVPLLRWFYLLDQTINEVIVSCRVTELSTTFIWQEVQPWLPESLAPVRLHAGTWIKMRQQLFEAVFGWTISDFLFFGDKADILPEKYQDPLEWLYVVSWVCLLSGNKSALHPFLARASSFTGLAQLRQTLVDAFMVNRDDADALNDWKNDVSLEWTMAVSKNSSQLSLVKTTSGKKYYAVVTGRKPCVYVDKHMAYHMSMHHPNASPLEFVSEKEAWNKVRSFAKGSPFKKRESSLTVHTDGACQGEKAGAGVWFQDGSEFNFSGPVEGKQTRDRAELYAVFQALRLIYTHRVYDAYRWEVVTDSQCAIDCITKKGDLWEKNGYMDSKGRPVENRDLVAIIRYFARETEKLSGCYHQIIFKHTHSKHHGNESAHRLAAKGIDGKLFVWPEGLHHPHWVNDQKAIFRRYSF